MRETYHPPAKSEKGAGKPVISRTRGDLEKELLGEARGMQELITSKPYKRRLNKERKRIRKLTTSESGKYKVIGIDKFDGEDFPVGEYNTAEEALKVARKKTKDAMKDASGPNIATMFYAYDPKGNYLGGDVWNKE